MKPIAQLSAILSGRVSFEHAFAQILPSLSTDVLSDVQHENRLRMYRANVIVAVTTALESAYPIVKMMVGDEFFYALCRQFWQQYPSRSGDLAEYSPDFPTFLATFPPVAEWPWLVDMARLEWQIHRQYYSVDVSVDAPQLLQAFAQQFDALMSDVEQAKDGYSVAWQWHPALIELDSPYAVGDMWHAHQMPEPDLSNCNIAQPQKVWVWRMQDKPQVQVASPEAEAFAQTLRQYTAHTADVSEVLTWQTDHSNWQTLLVNWLQRGVLVDWRLI
jgi:hypothetical protein